uniref:Putative secreted protein n=1 Tax=Anopheles marajoara TaxID=58244 RepID=A0A2M4CFE7_9DIPT
MSLWYVVVCVCVRVARLHRRHRDQRGGDHQPYGVVVPLLRSFGCGVSGGRCRDDECMHATVACVGQ